MMKCIVLYFLILWDLDIPSQQRPQELIADKCAGLWEAHQKELMAKALYCLVPFKNLLSH